MEKLRLTQTVQKGGCAAKVAATELRQILSKVEFPPTHKELLIDGRFFDDAAIYKVSEEIALVQTLDFFTPILDTPYQFGRVAACNALSDVYAMGGKPKTAMAVLAFPIASLSNETISEVLQGASDLLKEANCTLVGGHSIDDDSLKFGLSVTGYVNPNRVWSNQGAQDQDVLILTKPLGTGTLTAALKRSALTEEEISEAVKSMGRLNNIIDFLSDDLLKDIHAATDITGFGLSGHSMQMAKASDKKFVFELDKLPVFDLAQKCIESEYLTKAHRTNREYTASFLDNSKLTGWQKLLIHDPQTSGGLLLSVAPSSAQKILSKLETHFPKSKAIGFVKKNESDIRIEFV